MTGVGFGLKVIGEALSERGPFELLTSGAGTALGFFGGFKIGLLSGVPAGPPVIGVLGAVYLGEKFGIYGRTADDFWGTKPNTLAE